MENKRTLDALAGSLMEKEVLDAAEIADIFSPKPQEPGAEAA
jgi:ATP-dependent Zn protease